MRTAHSVELGHIALELVLNEDLVHYLHLLLGGQSAAAVCLVAARATRLILEVISAELAVVALSIEAAVLHLLDGFLELARQKQVVIKSLAIVMLRPLNVASERPRLASHVVTVTGRNVICSILISLTI